MIADDIVEAIGALAEEMGDTDCGEILVRLGVAPDEIRRVAQVAQWSVERVERSLVLMILDGLPAMNPLTQLPVAAWLDGFTTGLAVARRSSS